MITTSHALPEERLREILAQIDAVVVIEAAKAYIGFSDVEPVTVVNAEGNYVALATFAEFRSAITELLALRPSIEAPVGMLVVDEDGR